MNNDERREQRRQIAIRHTEYMEEKYHNEIQESLNHTKAYSSVKGSWNKGVTNNIQVKECDTVTAIFDSYKEDRNKHLMVLNFASYTNPGGGFIRGATAQEECLCMESFLYNVLKEQQEYYSWNRKNIENSLYRDRGLYSKDIYFIRDNEEVKADVITVASPNKSRFIPNNGYMIGDNEIALQNRIKFILNIAEENKKENTTLILGAFGCGVFRQDPEVVAELFKQYLRSGNYYFNEVVFAVIKGKNCEVFQKVFGQ